MTVVIVALIVSLIAPATLAYLTNRQTRANKLEDWARQDAVAAEAKRQQDEVAAQAAQAADLLLEENRRVRQATETTQSKLDVIHILVNSNMTAAMQAELDATRRELLLMEELGRSIMTMAGTKAKIAELETQLADRLRQAGIADQAT